MDIFGDLESARQRSQSRSAGKIPSGRSSGESAADSVGANHLRDSV